MVRQRAHSEPFVPSVPFVPALPAFLEDIEDWPEAVPGADLDRVLEADWDDIAGADLRSLFHAGAHTFLDC